MHKRSTLHLFLQSTIALVLLFFYSCADENKDAVVTNAHMPQEELADPKSNEHGTSDGSIVQNSTATDQLQHETKQKTENNKLQDQSINNSGKKKKKDVVVIEEIPPSIVTLSEENIHQETSMVDAGPPPPPQGKGEDDIYDFVSDMPVFPGGEAAMKLYIQKYTIYPEAEKLDSIQGTVYVSFVVEKDGFVSNVVLLRGVNGGPGLNKEAIRVVNSFPKFHPGKLDGQAVRTRMKIPLRFKL